MHKPYTLKTVAFLGGGGRIPTAMAEISQEGEDQDFSESAIGSHVADAIFKAIHSAIGLKEKVLDVRFSIKTKSDGTSPSWEIEVIVNFEGRGLYGGRITRPFAESTDPFVLVGEGYVDAVNRMLSDVRKPAIPFMPGEEAWYGRH